MMLLGANSSGERGRGLKGPLPPSARIARGIPRPGTDAGIPAAGGQAGSEAEAPFAAASEPARHLLALLERMEVRYCHWKSNIRLAPSLAGEGDLDLLVDRRHATRFQSALIASGFKPAVQRAGGGHPGVFHAFALDPDRGELVHVHAYFQVVTGDSLVKSYHFPVEETLLTDTGRMFGVPVPAAEAELVLFTLRIALKHASLAEILLVRRYYGTVVEELNWLYAAADIESVEAIWEAWFPGVPVSLMHDLIRAIAEPGAVWRRIFLARRLARQLRGWRRLGAAGAGLSRLRRLVSAAMGRFNRRGTLIPMAAGLVIAFVGPKATGKSTLGAATARRLGRHFDVRRAHVGKPPATAVSIVPRLVLPLARRLVPGERSREYDTPERRRDKHHSMLHVLRLALLAFDRRALVRRCWRHAAAGSIVIADRYPSPTTGAIDSSRFDDAALAQCRSRLKRWLMKRERALYAGLVQPALVIRLDAPIETTVRRDAERDKKEGADRAAVERRRQIETDTEFPDANVVTIDTDRPLEETMNKVMHAVWAAI